jgi:hypothetical protein
MPIGTVVAALPAFTGPASHRSCASVGLATAWWDPSGHAYDGVVDQAVVASRPALAPPRSRADEAMRRLLRIPEGQRPVDESETHRIFSASMLLSGLRCLLSYIILPVVLPAIGLAPGVGPAIGIPISLLALVFDWLGIRRFWLADHHQKWAFSALYAVVGGMVFALLVVDIVSVTS